MSAMQNYSRITREPDCFERQRARRAPGASSACEPGGGRGGYGADSENRLKSKAHHHVPPTESMALALGRAPAAFPARPTDEDCTVKTRILSFSDSNMAGSSWSWNFYLEDQESGAYRLSCQQVITDDEALVIEPVLRLRRGADVYSALEAMLSEAGNSLEENELASISAKIAKLNRRLAEQFEQGPTLLAVC